MISPTEDVTQPKPALSRHFLRTSSANQAFIVSLPRGKTKLKAELRSTAVFKPLGVQPVLPDGKTPPLLLVTRDAERAVARAPDRSPCTPIHQQVQANLIPVTTIAVKVDNDFASEAITLRENRSMQRYSAASGQRRTSDQLPPLNFPKPHRTPTPLQTFNELELLPAIQKALKAAKYTTPTEIQARAIPEGLSGRDVLGCAQTGTGKTAAFVLPILHHLGSNRRRPAPGHPHALILSPTRELAIQISDNISNYARFLKMRATLVYGGVSQIHQVRELRRGTRILVATPGRLLDLMEQGHLSLSHLEHFVLDEADRMLDMGFLPDLEKIISDLPEQRQSLFFSATLAPKISELAQGLLRDPVSINIAPEKRSLDQIEQFLTEVKTSEKIDRLTEILTSTDVRRAIVFMRTKRNTSKVEKKLSDLGLPVGSIHGDKSQNARQRTLMAFRRGKINILVATDVAARGIDVDDVSHVINFDLPEDAETYVHRIGRTGRAGANGTAITFYTAAQRRDVREIERYLGNETDADPTLTGPKQGGGKRNKGKRGGGEGRPPRKGTAKPRSRDPESRRGAARNEDSHTRETSGAPKRFKAKRQYVSKTRRQGADTSQTSLTGDREQTVERDRGTKSSAEKTFGSHRSGEKRKGGNYAAGKRSSDRLGSKKQGGDKPRGDRRGGQTRTESRRSEDASPDGERPAGKRPIRARQNDSRRDGSRKPRAKSAKGSRLETGSQSDSRGTRSDRSRTDHSELESGERRKKRKDSSKTSKKTGKRPQKRRAKKASHHFTEEFINQVKKAQKFRNRKKATKKAKPKRG